VIDSRGEGSTSGFGKFGGTEVAAPTSDCPCVALLTRTVTDSLQAFSSWLPTAAARVRARVWSSGICGGESGAGAGFLRVLRFPLPIFIPPSSPSS
jgi:hypothetical protein